MVRGIAALTCCLLASLYPLPAWAAKAVAASTNPGGKNGSMPGGNTWRFSDPTPADGIEFISGLLITDDTFLAKRHRGPFQKFNFPAGGGVAGATIAAFNPRTGVGDCLSEATSRSVSVSAPATGLVWGTNWYCGWSCSATGKIGKILPCNRIYWEAETEVKDPWCLVPASFDSFRVSEAHYDLFYAIGLDSVEYSPEGSLLLTTTYETAYNEVTLLSIELSSSGVKVTNDAPTDLFLYRLSSLTEGPTEIPSNLTSLSGIRSSLKADLAGDRVQNTPLYIGLVWQDIPVPVQTWDSTGALAKIHVNTDVRDRAQIGGGRGHLEHIADLEEPGDAADPTLSAPSLVPTNKSPQTSETLWLGEAVPNPAYGEVRIGFTLPREAQTTLRVYDLAGRLVATLGDEVVSAGPREVRWNLRNGQGRKVAPGIYVYQLNTETEQRTRRLLVLQ